MFARFIIRCYFMFFFAFFLLLFYIKWNRTSRVTFERIFYLAKNELGVKSVNSVLVMNIQVTLRISV